MKDPTREHPGPIGDLVEELHRRIVSSQPSGTFQAETPFRACLDCHSPLQEVFGGWRCPCGGALWRLDLLDAVEHRHVAEFLVAQAVNDPLYGRACPLCHEAFAVVTDDSAHRHSRIDVCLGCQVVWADPGDLQPEP